MAKSAPNVKAKEVVIEGSIEGNVTAVEKIIIRVQGSLIGDIKTAGIAIDDGAYFKGSIDITRPDTKQKAAPAPAKGAGNGFRAFLTEDPPMLRKRAGILRRGVYKSAKCSNLPELSPTDSGCTSIRSSRDKYKFAIGVPFGTTTCRPVFNVPEALPAISAGRFPWS